MAVGASATAPGAADEGSSGFERELEPTPYGIFDRDVVAGGIAEDNATSVAVMTDPGLLREFLACAANHPDLGVRGCLAAVRCGKASALVLLPASGPDSWDRRGLDVKAGCNALEIDVASRGRKGGTRAMLYSEHDLTTSAERALRPGDAPPNRLDPASDRDVEAFGRAYATLPATPRYVRHALALRHGLGVTDAALGCPSVLAPEESYETLNEIVRYVGEIRDRFDSALADAVGEIGGDPDGTADSTSDDLGADAVSPVSDYDGYVDESPRYDQGPSLDGPAHPVSPHPRGGFGRSPRAPATPPADVAGAVGRDTSDLSPDELIALITSEINGG